jgi:hypothetical protein
MADAREARLFGHIGDDAASVALSERTGSFRGDH